MTERQNTKCKICTLLLIQNDCETLKKLITKFNNPIFCMEIIPYLALFCRSFQEYANIELIDKEVDSEIYDIRNSIKIYGNRFGKSKEQFLKADEKQDDEFKDKLRFDFAKKLNIHYNLGIFFTKDKKIIGNTQLISNALNLNGLSDKEKSTKSYDLGYQLAKIINSISEGIVNSIPVPYITLRENVPTIYYDDFNTNKNNFFNAVIGKDINLFMLHILSNINFVKYVLESLFIDENLWMFRIKYITVYHAYLGLKKLKAHIENNRIELAYLDNSITPILKNGEILFASRFRNCMMHYNMENNGIFSVSEENFNEEKMFFGLVEDCFNGESYKQYLDKINCFGQQMEDLLTQQFNIESAHLKTF